MRHFLLVLAALLALPGVALAQAAAPGGGASKAIVQEAEAARDAAMAAANLYPDTAAGLAAAAEGGYFQVPSAVAGETTILYREVGGVAQEVKRYVTFSDTLTATAAGSTSARSIAAHLGDRLNVKDFGAKCDGTTDDTTAVQAAIDALMGATGAGPGGTLYFPPGTCRVDGQLVIRNDGQSVNPKQPFLRLTGQGAGAHGRWTTIKETAASRLDLRANSSIAKIDTRGFGILEIDHLLLMDGGSSSAAFIQTTNTTLRIHNAGFQGTAAGTSAVNDALIFGGTDGTGHGGSAATAPFQGYGTVVRDSWFSRIRRAATFQSAANAIQFAENTVGNDCGSGTAGDAPIMLIPGTGEQSRGNYIAGNLLEVTSYTYGVFLGPRSNSNTLIGNGIWDRGGATAGYRLESSGNTIFAYNDNFGVDGTSGTLTGNFVLNLSNGAVYTYMPVVRTPALIPIQDTQFPSNGGSASVNNTGAVTHLMTALASVASFTVSAPTVNPSSTGQVCTVVIRNASGGALAVTWNAAFKMAPWGSLANGFYRTISFYYDGTSWIETSRTPADVPA